VSYCHSCSPIFVKINKALPYLQNQVSLYGANECHHAKSNFLLSGAIQNIDIEIDFSGLPSRILNLYWIKWAPALAFVWFSFVC